MKKLALLIAAVLLIALAAAGCGQTAAPEAASDGIQIASAWIQNGDEETRTLVTIDLSGGWSVEFALGAFYMTENMQSTGDDCTAMGVSLSKEVYDEYMAEAQQSDSYTELDNAVMYKDSYDGSTNYLFTAGDNGYFVLTVYKDADGDAVLARITAEAE